MAIYYGHHSYNLQLKLNENALWIATHSLPEHLFKKVFFYLQTQDRPECLKFYPHPHFLFYKLILHPPTRSPLVTCFILSV